MKKLLNIYSLEILLLLIIALTPLLWYKDGSMALGHDMGFPLAPLDYFKDRLFTWTDRIGTFGSNQTDSLNGVFIHGIEAALTALGLSLIHTQQLSFIFWLFLPGLTMYILLKSLHPKPEEFPIRVIGSVFYMMNYYLLQAWVIAERTKFSIVAAIPLVVLILINVFYREKSLLKQVIIFSLILFFLNGGAGIPLWGGLAVVVLTFFIVFFVISRKPWQFKVFRGLSFFVLAGIFWLLLNIYWVYPYLSSFQQNYTDRVNVTGGGDGAVGWSHELSKNASFTNLFQLQGIPDWYGNPDHPYASTVIGSPIFITISFLFPLMVFSNLFFLKRITRDQRVYIMGFLSVIVLSLPLVAGSHPPFGFVYDFLLRNLPGFSIFRTPIYKFGMALWFAYAYLFAAGCYYVMNFFIQRKNHNYAYKCIILILILGLIAVYNFPYFTGSFFNWSKDYSTMVKVPDYIFEVKKELDLNKFSTRAVLLPGLDLGTRYESYNWKYFSLSTIPSMLSRNPVVINDAVLIGIEVNLLNGLFEQLFEGRTPSLLRLTGADKVLVRNDFKGDDIDKIKNEKLKNDIKSNSSLSFSKKIGKWDLYQINNKNLLPRVLSSDSVSFIQSDPDVLDLIAQLPGNFTSEPFLYRNWENRDGFLPYLNNMSKIVLQGICANCTPEKSLYSINPIVPRILPGSKLYELVRLYEGYMANRIKDPSQKIDYVLGNITKRVSVVNSYIEQDKKDNVAINYMLNDWKGSLLQIKGIHNTITDPVAKEQSSNKIYYFARQFLLDTQKWKEGDTYRHKYYESEFSLFAVFLKDLISSPEFSQERAREATNQRKYILKIPQDGRYTIFIHPNLDAKNKIKSFPIKVADQEILLTDKDYDGIWLKTPPLDLKSGDVDVIFLSQPIDFTNILAQPNFKVEANNFEANCQEIRLDNLDLGGTYRMKFTYRGTNKGYLNVTMREEGRYVVTSPPERKFLADSFVSKDSSSNSQNIFGLSTGTEHVVFNFCIDPYDTNPSGVEIQDLKFDLIPYVSVLLAASEKNKPTAYNPLEFVALNQTKYLVRFNDNMKNAILQYNSRYDGNWKIREVDATKAASFFTGDKKDYVSVKAIEYTRQDNHIMTDLYFPDNGSVYKQISLNKITNMWVLDGVRDKVYLIEYTIQNEFYKTAFLSLGILVSLIAFLFYLSKHGKKS